MALLEIESLQVEFPIGANVLRAVDDVSISVDEGEVLGIVGESGSGKSVTMLALMGLVAYPGRVRAKRMSFAGRDLLTLSERERRQLTGRDMAMIFQEPATSLNPCFSIGFQLTETLRAAPEAVAQGGAHRAVELLEQVGIPDPARRLQDYPHQMSGGMNQRVMIAMAIACNPKLLIADEPTTALDVTIQAQILDLLRRLQRERGMALVLITHNMGVVAEMAQRVAVMYAGQVVEDPQRGIFSRRLSIRTPPRCCRRCRSNTLTTAIASRRFRAWCQVSTTGRAGVFSVRAARVRPCIATKSSQGWIGSKMDACAASTHSACPVGSRRSSATAMWARSPRGRKRRPRPDEPAPAPSSKRAT